MERKALVALRPADETLMDKALKQLVRAGNVVQPKRGVYELVVSSEPPSLEEAENQKPIIAMDPGEVEEQSNV